MATIKELLAQRGYEVGETMVVSWPGKEIILDTSIDPVKCETNTEMLLVSKWLRDRGYKAQTGLLT